MQLPLIKGSRTKLLAILVIAIMAIFVARLFYIQVVRHGHYKAEARSGQMKQFVLRAERGEIYAMDGDNPTKLVMNETVYTVWADPTQIKDRSKVESAVNRIAGGNTRSDFARYLNRKDTRYQVLATKVSRKQAELLKKENLAGVGFDAGTQRVYPEGQLASQVLGFVDAEGNGKYGFEQAGDKRLKGKDGMQKTVTDIRSVPLTIGDENIEIPADDGDDVVLSIDRNIQAKVESALQDAAKKTGAKQVSAIVMNPHNGQVIAMANMPTYDPTNISSIQDISLLNNPTIDHPYEVGSVSKTFTVAMGLDKRVIAPDSTFVNTDEVRVYDAVIRNASRGVKMGTITMQDALDWSLNTGMVTIARKIGGGNEINLSARKTMYDYLHNKFKLGSQTGIELAGEAPGTIISPDEVQGNAVRYSNMSFGQGMDLTMVQTAAGFGSVINGGTYYHPTVVAGKMSEDGEFQKTNVRLSEKGVITAEASSAARQMIHGAHIATYKQPDREGFYIGGKTGTSETIDPTTGKYRDNETIATYLGFGGSSADDPSYVIMTTVSGGGKFSGGVHAKPIFTDISNWLIDYLKLQPKG